MSPLYLIDQPYEEITDPCSSALGPKPLPHRGNVVGFLGAQAAHAQEDLQAGTPKTRGAEWVFWATKWWFLKS